MATFVGVSGCGYTGSAEGSLKPPFQARAAVADKSRHFCAPVKDAPRAALGTTSRAGESGSQRFGMANAMTLEEPAARSEAPDPSRSTGSSNDDASANG